MSESQKDLPIVPCKAYNSMLVYWLLIDRVIDGFQSILVNKSSIIQKLYLENEDQYNKRLQHLEFLPLLSRLVDLSSSLLTQKPIQLLPIEGVSIEETERLQSHLNNIDSDKNSINVFIYKFLKIQVSYSIAGILVDAPPVPEGGISLSDEIRLNYRPFWSIIHPQNVIGWRHEEVGAEKILTHLRIKSAFTRIKEDSKFLEEIIPCIKTYDLEGNRVVVRTYYGNDCIEQVDQEKYINLPYIPYFSLNTSSFYSLDPFFARPDLLELAHLNIQHTAIGTNLNYALIKAANPILKRTKTEAFASYEDNKTIDTSGDTLLKAELGEDYQWLALPSDGFKALSDKLAKYESDAKSMWLARIFDQTSYQESGLAKQISHSQGNSPLLQLAQGLESLLNSCLQAHCDLMDKTKIGQKPIAYISVNRDIDSTAITEGIATTLSDLQLKNQITLKTLLTTLQKGQVIPDNINIDQEIESLSL